MLRKLQARVAAGFATLARSVPTPPATKASAVSMTGDAGWRPIGSRHLGQFYSGSDVNWEKQAGYLLDNGVVSICVGHIMKKIVEPRPEIVTESEDGSEEKSKVRDHELLTLLNKPNPLYSGKALFQATAISFQLVGEAFWIKVRGGRRNMGKPKELWYVPHWEMEPVNPPGGIGPTLWYKRHVGGGKTEYYAAEDVVHFRFGIDPRNPRRGWSNFRAMFTEVVSDREIATFTATVLRNLGVIGYLVSPDSKDDTFEDPNQIKEKIRSSITGDNRADLVVTDIPIKVTKVGYSPQELAISTMGDRPESRICASFGLNTMAVNLPSGTANMKYANFKEARSATWEDCFIPMLTLFEETIQESLGEEMGLRDDEVFGFNYEKVRDLQPDLNAVQKRARENWSAGAWKLSEIRKATGQKVDPGEPDGFIWQLDIRKRDSGTGKETDPNADPNDPNKEPDTE